MGDRKLRNVERFDYSVYNSVGERVPLPQTSEEEQVLLPRNIEAEQIPKMSADAKAIAKASGELSGLLFQVTEILDDLMLLVWRPFVVF